MRDVLDLLTKFICAPNPCKRNPPSSAFLTWVPLVHLFLDVLVLPHDAGLVLPTTGDLGPVSPPLLLLPAFGAVDGHMSLALPPLTFRSRVNQRWKEAWLHGLNCPSQRQAHMLPPALCLYFCTGHGALLAAATLQFEMKNSLH